MQRFTDSGQSEYTRAGMAMAAMQSAHWSEEAEQRANDMDTCDGYYEIDGAYMEAERDAEDAVAMMKEATAG